ncbi:MAG: SagB/ThcOx family dehydrogenase [Bryobacterales bacterium]|nr:SagB/ThcOx family dehydrogenase [Bryobacterales bacterium]
MNRFVWESARLAPGEPDQVWETFHENSKLSRMAEGTASDEVSRRMTTMYEALPFEAFPAVPLPERAPLSASLDVAMNARVSARKLEAQPVSLDKVAALLHAAYGITRDNKGTPFPRGFRTIPSAGALYPLEIYLHSTRVDGLKSGIYHFNPAENNLRYLQEGDFSRQIAEAMVQPEMPFSSSIIFFFTALFERVVFKYGERGYRFTLLEAGHAAQNLNLAAQALGMGTLNVGGYFDRPIDRLLGLDGVTHSTVYMVCAGFPDEKGQGDAIAPPDAPRGQLDFDKR